MSNAAAASMPASDSVNIAPYLNNFAERSAAGRELRRLPDDSIKDLKESGYIRAMVPAQLGGMELTPKEFFEIQTEIAEYDMSTAWVGGIIA